MYINVTRTEKPYKVTIIKTDSFSYCMFLCTVEAFKVRNLKNKEVQSFASFFSVLLKYDKLNGLTHNRRIDVASDS